MTTLTDGTTTIDLPDSMEWVNEFEFTPVDQTVNQTIGGGVVISESPVLAGRSIILDTGSDVWVKKSVIDQLLSMVSQAGVSMTLTLTDGRQFNVIIDRSGEGKGVYCKPVWRKNSYLPDDDFTMKISFLEV